MVFVFDRENKAFVDNERKLLFKEAGMSRPDIDFLSIKYKFRVEDTVFIRQTLLKNNDVFRDWSEERDKYNKRKYTVRLGEDPWIEIINMGTQRIAGPAVWTNQTETMFREAMYAYYSKQFGDQIDKIRVVFGTSGHADSLETFVPAHPVYEAED